jgi:hypothetical protein
LQLCAFPSLFCPKIIHKWIRSAGDREISFPKLDLALIGDIHASISLFRTATGPFGHFGPKNIYRR